MFGNRRRRNRPIEITDINALCNCDGKFIKIMIPDLNYGKSAKIGAGPTLYYYHGKRGTTSILLNCIDNVNEVLFNSNKVIYGILHKSPKRLIHTYLLDAAFVIPTAENFGFIDSLTQDDTFDYFCTKDKTLAIFGQKGHYDANINIPETIAGLPVTDIFMEGYASVDEIQQVHIPDTIVRIQRDAFCYCSNLKTIYIGSGVEEIGPMAFYYCNKVENFIVDKNNQYFTSIDGVLYTKDQSRLVLFPANKSGTYSVLPGVKCIGEKAFHDSTLTSLFFPNSLTTIEDYAFSNAANLTKIVLPESVISIGHHAFGSKYDKFSAIIGVVEQSMAHKLLSNCNEVNFTIEVTNYKEDCAISEAKKQQIPNEKNCVLQKQISRLGWDERKHIQCNYEDNEDACPKECSKCAFSIKTDGDISLAQNLLDEAIKNYKKAVFVEPKFAEAWVNLGNAYGMKSEYNNALSAFNKAIAIDPVYGKALYGKAITLRNLGNLEEAMETVNNILRLYDADEVSAFKKGLIDAGVEDTQYVLENEEYIQELDNYGYDIADDNNLLNGQEFYDAIEECGDIYRPDEFINAVMHYCRKKYAPLGENKIRGEYIITSFYGSICAALFYAKDNSVFENIEPFNYLMENIDVEFTDRNAERMLQTKAGEEKAEYIWSIILPYVKFSQEIFSKTSKLTDELILCAIKNAYELGLLTAFYYINGRDKKHVIASREEIDNALSDISTKTPEKEVPPVKSAMCYSPRR